MAFESLDVSFGVVAGDEMLPTDMKLTGCGSTTSIAGGIFERPAGSRGIGLVGEFETGNGEASNLKSPIGPSTLNLKVPLIVGGRVRRGLELLFSDIAAGSGGLGSDVSEP